MNTRGGNQLDYRILHETGKKVYKVQGRRLEMAEKIKVDELKVRGDIKYAVTMYDITAEITEDAVIEGKGVVKDLSQKFRHTHVEWKNALGDDYENEYPDYITVSEKLITFIKNAKSKLKDLKQKKRTMKKVSEEKIKAGLRIEDEVLSLKIKQLDMFEMMRSSDPQEVEYYIIKVEML